VDCRPRTTLWPDPFSPNQGWRINVDDRIKASSLSVGEAAAAGVRGFHDLVGVTRPACSSPFGKHLPSVRVGEDDVHPARMVANELCVQGLSPHDDMGLARPRLGPTKAKAKGEEGDLHGLYPGCHGLIVARRYRSVHSCGVFTGISHKSHRLGLRLPKPTPGLGVARVQIDREITCDRPFFASVGKVAIDGRSGALSIELPSRTPSLDLGRARRSGGDFRAKIQEGSRTLCTVADWKVPAGGGWCGDAATFSV